MSDLPKAGDRVRVTIEATLLEDVTANDSAGGAWAGVWFGNPQAIETGSFDRFVLEVPTDPAFLHRYGITATIKVLP